MDKLLYTSIIVLAAIPANILVLLYILWTPPWLSRHKADSTFFFLLMAGLTGLIDLTIVYWITGGDTWWYLILRTAIHLTIMTQLWYALYLTVKLNRPRYIGKHKAARRPGNNART